MNSSIERAEAFCKRFGLRVPILLAPMASASAPSLSIAVANAGGLGSCGALPMRPHEIIAWSQEVRSKSNGAFQLNTWIPDPAPRRDRAHEVRVCQFLESWGPPVTPEAGDATPPDFDAQCEAMLEAGPLIVSSIMGLFPPNFVGKLKERGIAWFASISTVAEARAAEQAGADVIVAQGAEAGALRLPNLLPTPCNEASPLACAQKGRKRAMFNVCRPGRVNPLRLQRPSRPPILRADSGPMRKHFWPDDSRLAAFLRRKNMSRARSAC
jgi:hypothetical protein